MRAGGPEQARRTLEECQRLLANPRLSEEMRQGLEQRVEQLRAEINDSRTAARHPPVIGGGSTRPPRR
jgi:hypothetical protein